MVATKFSRRELDYPATGCAGTPESYCRQAAEGGLMSSLPSPGIHKLERRQRPDPVRLQRQFIQFGEIALLERPIASHSSGEHAVNRATMTGSADWRPMEKIAG